MLAGQCSVMLYKLESPWKVLVFGLQNRVDAVSLLCALVQRAYLCWCFGQSHELIEILTSQSPVLCLFVQEHWRAARTESETFDRRPWTK